MSRPTKWGRRAQSIVERGLGLTLLCVATAIPSTVLDSALGSYAIAAGAIVVCLTVYTLTGLWIWRGVTEGKWQIFD